MQTLSSARRTCMASASAVECTATVAMPNSLQARKMRSAISPRLAIRILSNIAAPDVDECYSIITSGSPNSTGWPSSTRICVTVPARGDGIWFIVFIASMITSVCPIDTLAPTSMNGLAPGSEAQYTVPTMGEGTTPGCLPSSATATGVAETDMTVAAAGDDVATAIEMLRATRTRKPARSISISVRLVSSSSKASSRISALSSLLNFAAGLSSGWRAICRSGTFCLWQADASGFCLDTDPGGKAGDREPVAIDAETGKHCKCGLGGEGMMTEILAGVNIADVHLDGGNLHRHQRVMQRDRGVRIAGGIDDDTGRLRGVCLVDEIDQFAFAIGLSAIGFQAEPG